MPPELLIVFDTAPVPIAAKTLQADPSSPILSVSSKSSGVLTRQLASAAETAAYRPAQMSRVLESVECQSPAFLERYAQERKVQFGRVTLSDVLSLMGYLPGPEEPILDSAIEEMSKPIAEELTRGSRMLVSAQGDSSAPVCAFVCDLLRRFGAGPAVVSTFSKEYIAQSEHLTETRLPAGAAPIRFTSPAVVLLLLVNYMAHPRSLPAEEHPCLNASGLSRWAFKSGFDQLLPPAKRVSRGYRGLYKELKGVCDDLATEGLMARFEGARPGPRGEYYRLTPLGHAYARFVFKMVAFIDEQAQELLASDRVEAIRSAAVDILPTKRALLRPN